MYTQLEDINERYPPIAHNCMLQMKKKTQLDTKKVLTTVRRKTFNFIILIPHSKITFKKKVKGFRLI